jgi:hypothetical protein
MGSSMNASLLPGSSMNASLLPGCPMNASLPFSFTACMMRRTRPRISAERFLPKASKTALAPYLLRPSQIAPLTTYLLLQQCRSVATSNITDFYPNHYCVPQCINNMRETISFPTLLMRHFFSGARSPREDHPTMSHSYGLHSASDAAVPVSPQRNV